MEYFKICKICNKKIEGSPSYVLKRTYCSQKCKWQDPEFISKQQKAMREKVYDNKEVRAKMVNSQRECYKRDPTRAKRCTEAPHKKARELAREKIKTGNFNKGISKRGDVILYIPLEGWKKEHHYVWKKAGNEIPEGYCIHHINGDHKDNRLENLKLLTKGEHSKLHYLKRKIDKLGRFV